MRTGGRHVFAFVALLAIAPLVRGGAESGGVFNEEALLKKYRANNEVPTPVVSYLNWGMLNIAVFPDGRTILPGKRGPQNPSGVMEGRLNPETLSELLSSLRAVNDFWKLDSNYKLTRWSEQPLHIISLNITDTTPKKVEVYGNLTKRMDDEQPTPEAFVRVAAILRAVALVDARPFDPGYFEITFADYGYAPDASIVWPREWPGLNSPLCRETPKTIIRQMMVFPSSELSNFEAFLKTRQERGAVLIDGWKASIWTHWPLPGEKKWTSWTQ